MRELKFRAWDKKGKRWCGHNVHIDCDGLKSWCFGYTCEPVLSGDFEVMQFTGLKDKDGKEIYEGDILRSESGNTFELKHEIQEWCEDGFYSGYLLFGTSDQYTVIGNIYENPKLLESERTQNF